MEAVESVNLVSVNDVSPTGLRSFYATNDNGWMRHHPLNALSLIIPMLSGSSVVHWDGQSVSFAVAPGSFSLANGIAVSPDGRQVHVADTMGAGALRTYARGADDVLVLTRTLDLGTGLDNLSLAADGSIYIGCHPNSLRFLRHALTGHLDSPSQVIRVSGSFPSPQVDEIYLSNGDGEAHVAASSTGLVIGPYLVITPVFGEKIEICQ